MFLNYLKIAFRNLKKNKGYSFINIFGLAVGIACCIIILLFIQNEFSYDKYNKNYHRIYRICLDAKISNNELNSAQSSGPCGQAFVQEIPEVENYTRLRNYGFPVIRYKDKAFSEERFYWVDSSFFDVFTVHFIEGNPETALIQPNSVVITKSTAKKYFGNEEPIGKLLNSDRRKDYMVTGVIDDFPVNSSFHFDFLGSLASYQMENDRSWLSNNYETFILVKENVNSKELEEKIQRVSKAHIGPELIKVVGITYEQMFKGGSRYNYIIQPLSDIHLRSHRSNEIEPPGDILYVYIFSIIAFAILLIACINFTNLATARSSGRAKEVGIRKTLGSNQALLIRQFLTETILMSFIAMLFALLIVELFLPTFNSIANKHLDLQIFSNYYSVPILIVFVIIVGIIAGIYPAFVLSSLIPVKVLRGKLQRTSTKSFLRNFLVITQFSITIVLIVGAFIVDRQVDFVRNKKLGFNREQILIVKKTDDIGKDIQSFKNDITQLSSISDITNSTSIPGELFGDSAFRREGGGTEEVHDIRLLFTDYDFINTYQIKMLQGRFFSKDYANDTMAVVINEEAVKAMGIKDPLGKYLIRVGDNAKFKIIGITDNFNFESLHQKIQPLIFGLFRPAAFGRFVSVRFTSQYAKNAIKDIETIWHRYAGSQAFEYSFFNDDFAKLYASEQRTGQIFSIFSILAIFIACLGLLGLAAYTAEQRTKEIGIRKVLGATVSEIILMLTKEFTKWVLIANIIAWPAAYFLMNGWLENFAYRINLNIWVFILSGILALLIAVLTVSYQAIKAAITNPVESLRYE
ncbi:MAG TPA: ABC transporter permease [Ignavibacteriaceae bacterium]|nr:ABC transporter permease [Ignavibacteriaceae bacterium]